MPQSRPLTILCVSSYEKGQEFLRTCKAIGCRVLLLTVEKLRDAGWPFECIDEVFTMPEGLSLQKRASSRPSSSTFSITTLFANLCPACRVPGCSSPARKLPGSA